MHVSSYRMQFKKIVFFICKDYDEIIYVFMQAACGKDPLSELCTLNERQAGSLTG